MKRDLHPRLLADLRRRRRRSGPTRAFSSMPRSASRTTGRGSPPTSTRSSRGTSTASTRRSPTSAPTPTSRRPTTTTTSSPTAATSRGSPTRDRCRTTAGTSSRSRAIYETPWQLSVGLSAYWRSGTPLTRYGYSDIYGRYEFFLTEARRRGADAGHLRGGPPPRLPDRGRPGEDQPAFRRLQPARRPAAAPARPALGFPGGGQCLPHSHQPGLQETGAANAAAVVPAGGAAESVGLTAPSSVARPAGRRWRSARRGRPASPSGSGSRRREHAGGLRRGRRR